MKYLYLAVAIVAETVATSCMKQSDGFTKLIPSSITIVGYVITFYFLSLALRDIPTGIAYAIWAGVGIVLIAAVAWIFQGQKLDLPAILGIGMIVAGVVVMNVFSKTASH